MKKDIRVAVVGCGYWGKNLVRNFYELGVLKSVCDGSAETRKRMTDQYSGLIVVSEISDILKDPEIDGVVFATPAEFHFEHASMAIKAGKHVYVEKPLALSMVDAQELVRLAEQNDRILMVGHLLQYHNAFLKLREMVRDGVLGKLQYIYSNRLNLGKIRQEEDVFWSFAPHDVSMILSLVGEEPSEISAEGSRHLSKTIADVTLTNMKFPSGVGAHIFVSWLHPFKEQKLVVVGENGMAVFNDGMPWDSKLQIYPHKIDWVDGLPIPVKAEPQNVQLEEGEPLRNECSHFVECIANGRTPRTDGHEGVRVLNVLRLASEKLEANSKGA